MSHGRGRRVGRVLAAFGLTAVVLAGFVSAVGPRRVAAELAGADPRPLVVAAVAAVAAVLVWSEALRLLLATTVGPRDAVPRGRRYRRAFLAGDFAKQVLPMGHASGPAVMAYAVASTLDVDYEAALATVTVADLLHLVASVSLATVGLAVLVATGGPSAGLTTFAAGLAAATAAVTVALALVTVRRDLLVTGVRAFAGLCGRLVGRAVPRLGRATSPAAVERALTSYFRTFDAVAAARLRLCGAAALALVGWLLFAAPLALAALALDATVPLALALFVVPVAGLATWLPTPGGSGGVEVAVAAALVAATGVGLGTAAAVALTYRLCAYWTVVAVDGLAAASLLVDRRTRGVGAEGGAPAGPDEP